MKVQFDYDDDLRIERLSGPALVGQFRGTNALLRQIAVQPASGPEEVVHAPDIACVMVLEEGVAKFRVGPDRIRF